MAGLVTPLLPGVHEYFAHKYLQLDNIFSSTHQISRYLKIKVYLRCSQNLNKHVFRIYVNLLLTQTQDTSIYLKLAPCFVNCGEGRVRFPVNYGPIFVNYLKIGENNKMTDMLNTSSCSLIILQNYILMINIRSK